VSPAPLIDVVTAGLGVRQGFIGRRGGASGGIFASLNVGLGSTDDPAHVRENRRRAVAAVAAVADADRPQADAMVTATPGLALGILTADCAPILLADPQAGVIGAAHSGWKGALGDIAGATVSAMEALGARRDNIRAAIGPCIARASYEVDAGFRDRFLADAPAHDGFFSRGRGDRFQFDLEGLVARRLADAGVRHVTMLGIDTYPDAARWFSYRRTTHAGEPDYGRQISVIAL
jgi:polyphenol oxidase